MEKHYCLKASAMYEAPDLKICAISVETGFADSGIGNYGNPIWEQDGVDLIIPSEEIY